MRDGKLVCWITLALVLTTGCNVQVDKSGDGKNVKIATPFASIAVDKNQTTAAEVGLPAYPGAQLTTNEDGGDSARVDMGFGDWKLRVRVAQYKTADDRDQVLAFYRKALSSYGAVIECADKRTIGTPVRTGEGLTCDDDSKHSIAHGGSSADDIQLKAGSPHHQHLVAIKSEGSGTHFGLVELTLPHRDDEQHGTN